jgi:Zn-dependent protease/CBS domain-containing protein
MKAQIKLGRVFGIPIGLHYSWLLIALLVVLSLAQQFGSTNAQWGAAVIWGTAIVTALLFFAAIVVHELAHAAVAKAHGLPVRSITLFALGGVSEIEKEASDARTEFWMGIAGPITSAVIGIVCLGLAGALGWMPGTAQQSPVVAMLGWLGVINIGLAIFNMIPGFPLDGGRVLRGILWWITGDSRRATRMAARIGQLIALAFIVYGLIFFFRGGGFGGLWLTFIGWFLLDASRSSYAQVELVERLEGIRARDLMKRDCEVIDGDIDLQTFVDEHLLRSGRRCFVVQQNGGVAGLITANEVKHIDRVNWPRTTVRDAMLPLERLHSVPPSAPLLDALEMMGREDVNQLPVLKDGQLAGVISRSDILRLLHTRAELGK